ncbi:PfkB family carbohydrate kinase [Streptomyces sp. NPDC006259]|uniref:PfkB family carbohydrate kinase n=1 Tax=Streptomyces sp. NPDC006259 TaxID=3364740 RepID=UPI0036CA4984
MTDIVVPGSTDMHLVAHVETTPRPGETLTGRESRTTSATASRRAGTTAHPRGTLSTTDTVSRTDTLSTTDTSSTTGTACTTDTACTTGTVDRIPPELLAVTGLSAPEEHHDAALTGRGDPWAAAAPALLGTVEDVVVRPGAAGSRCAVPGTEPVTAAAPRLSAVDSTGVGDTRAGALAVAPGEDRPVRESPVPAAAATAFPVRRRGAAASTPYRSEIEKQHTS